VASQLGAVTVVPITPLRVQKVELGLTVKEGYDEISKKSKSIGKDINGWNVGAAFGDRAFYNGNYLLRAGAAAAGI